jgi:hypothetical protein
VVVLGRRSQIGCRVRAGPSQLRTTLVVRLAMDRQSTPRSCDRGGDEVECDPKGLQQGWLGAGQKKRRSDWCLEPEFQSAVEAVG